MFGSFTRSCMKVGNYACTLQAAACPFIRCGRLTFWGCGRCMGGVSNSIQARVMIIDIERDN